MSEIHEVLQSETGFTRCNRVLSMFYIEKCLLGPGKMVEFAVRSRSYLMSEPSSWLLFNTCYIGIKLGLCSQLEFPVFSSYQSIEFPVIDCINILMLKTEHKINNCNLFWLIKPATIDFALSLKCTQEGRFDTPSHKEASEKFSVDMAIGLWPTSPNFNRSKCPGSAESIGHLGL